MAVFGPDNCAEPTATIALRPPVRSRDFAAVPNGHPTFWLIAGPNGVGKTTFARARLEAISGSINFIECHEIARGLSPLRPAAAERDAAVIALDRARRFIATRTTFAMETTLAGKAHLRLVRAAKAAGMVCAS